MTEQKIKVMPVTLPPQVPDQKLTIQDEQFAEIFGLYQPN
jgi:hypothetical protein